MSKDGGCSDRVLVWSCAAPVILPSTRSDVSGPFNGAQPVAGISGFVEAPSLSCDGRSLYYHRREGNDYFVLRAERAP